MAVAGLAAALLVLQRATDTTIYATPAARVLVERAASRHRARESDVTDYQARLHFRTSFSFGRRAWARIPVAAAEELDAALHWQAPNDLRVDVRGRRGAARDEELDFRTFFTRPWFFPRGVGDSVQLFGQDFPEQAALHPLAPDGPAWYHYAIVDSQRVVLPQGDPIRIYNVEVTPRHTGQALVIGFLQVDSATAEVVRFSFRFVGTELWVARLDDASARRVEAAPQREWLVEHERPAASASGRDGAARHPEPHAESRTTRPATAAARIDPHAYDTQAARFDQTVVTTAARTTGTPR